MSLAWHPAGCSGAGPPRGSGQPASHEPGRAPEQTLFVWGRVVGANGTQAPEPALPPPPRRDPRPGQGPCRGGREAARHNRTERGPWGYVNPRAAQESGVAVAWRGEQSLPPSQPRCPRPSPGGPAGAMPARLSPTAGPPARAGGAGGAGWAGTCRGRRGRRGSRGRSRSARPWPGARWGQRGAPRGPQPHNGCNECSVLSPHWFKEGARNPLPPSCSPRFQPSPAQPVFPAWLKEGWPQHSSPRGWELGGVEGGPSSGNDGGGRKGELRESYREIPPTSIPHHHL